MDSPRKTIGGRTQKRRMAFRKTVDGAAGGANKQVRKRRIAPPKSLEADAVPNGLRASDGRLRRAPRRPFAGIIDGGGGNGRRSRRVSRVFAAGFASVRGEKSRYLRRGATALLAGKNKKPAADAVGFYAVGMLVMV